MKIRNIIVLMAIALLTVSCMDGDWQVPHLDPPPYGNQGIKESNVISIAELKTLYPQYSQENATLMDKDAQLKVYVSGNDIEGNLYNSIAVQDENGDAMIVCVYENSLFAYLAVGQEILIDTKGLYIGSYGGQPQIGTPYTNKGGVTFPSRMNSQIWQAHFKLLPTMKQNINIPQYTLAQIESLNKSQHAGKLMKLVGVEVDGADGKKTWASKADAGSYSNVQLYFKGGSRNTMIYTSTYADFANEPIPMGKLNLTGVWKVYRNKWELVLRSQEDIEIAK